MEIRQETQKNPVADDVSALIAVTRPILAGLLWALKADVVDEVGGRDRVKLKLLPRLRRPSDGDCGICFEYAVHDALRRHDPMVLERVDHALARLCRIPGGALESILFAVEKTGTEQLIDTAKELITPYSVLMHGTRGRPVNLQKHIDGIAQAFRRPSARTRLPSSISGVWKADLFLGMTDTDKWVATSVKINVNLLEGALGLRVGVVPAKDGRHDKPYQDDQRNLVVCPLLHDGNFMQIFYEAWIITQQVLEADLRLPPLVALPRPSSRTVARLLVERREYSVSDVIEALRPIAQPDLLVTEERPAELVLTRGAEPDIRAIIAPIGQKIPGPRHLREKVS